MSKGRAGRQKRMRTENYLYEEAPPNKIEASL